MILAKLTGSPHDTLASRVTTPASKRGIALKLMIDLHGRRGGALQVDRVEAHRGNFAGRIQNGQDGRHDGQAAQERNQHAAAGNQAELRKTPCPDQTGYHLFDLWQRLVYQSVALELLAAVRLSDGRKQ